MSCAERLHEPGCSLAADRRKSAKSAVEASYGDQGDQPRKKVGTKKGSKKQ